MKNAAMLSCAALTLAVPACIAPAEEVSAVAVADVTLYENSFGDSANGIGEAVFIGKNNSNSIYRTLLRFDLAALVPANATIESASLTLYCNRTIAGNEPATIHRVLADWGEGQSLASGNGGAGTQAQKNDATWLYRFFVPPFGAGSPAWANAGGDFEPLPSATMIIGGEFNFYTWSSEGLAQDVQSWVDGSLDNFGWMILGREEGSSRSSKRFDSKDGVTPALRPTLNIVYSVEADCPADLAAPVGVLDLADVQAFVDGFVAADPIADFSEPSGVYDLADIQAFITAFLAGCP